MSHMARWLPSVEEDRDPEYGAPTGTYSIMGPRGYRVHIPPTPFPRSPPAGYGQPIGDAFGNYRSLLGGRVVLGPQPILFSIHCVGFVTILFILSLQAEDINNQFGMWILVLGFLLHGLSFFLFLSISSSDPGVIPRNYSMTELIRDTNEYRQRNPGERFYRYCRKCGGFRPPKCYHCNRCNICIREQEMHLMAGGICIGERTSRAFLLLTLSLGFLAWYLFIINVLILVKLKEEEWKPVAWHKIMLYSISSLSGLFLLCLPQVGIIMFLFRIYHIGSGTTSRMIFQANQPDELDCAKDVRSTCQNFKAFFFRFNRPSAFRKKYNAIGPDFRSMDEHWLAAATAFFSAQDNENPDNIVQIHEENSQVDLNANNISLVIPQIIDVPETLENLELRTLAANARHKTHPSVPHLDAGGMLEQIPGARVKTSLKSKPYEMIQMQIDEFQKAKEIPKAVLSYKKHHLLPSTLSDGCIPRNDKGQDLIQTARAEQFRRIIHLVLLRDREGLIQMSRRVNLAGLLGLEQFDPDNLQFVELSNGLPMLAPRRRDAGAGMQMQFNRFGGLLGIPQMVAAGLLPTARQIAADVEQRLGLGPGSVIRRTHTIPAGQRIPAAVVNLVNPQHVRLPFLSQRRRIPNSPGRALDTSRTGRGSSNQTEELALAQRRLERATVQRIREIAYNHPLWGQRLHRREVNGSGMHRVDTNVNNERRVDQVRVADGANSTRENDTVPPQRGRGSDIPHPSLRRGQQSNNDGSSSNNDVSSSSNAISSRNAANLTGLRGNNENRQRDDDDDEDEPQVMVMLNDGTVMRPP